MRSALQVVNCRIHCLKTASGLFDTTAAGDDDSDERGHAAAAEEEEEEYWEKPRARPCCDRYT